MLFLVDTKMKTTTPASPESFVGLSLTERNDLQEWVLARPSLLGEDLLVVTSEFNQFDRTAERLDVLMLDRAGTLVVVELKRSAVGTAAELQALRYAAYCSTLSFDDLVEMYAARRTGTTSPPDTPGSATPSPSPARGSAPSSTSIPPHRRRTSRSSLGCTCTPKRYSKSSTSR
jgi:hypothetical protein